MTNIGERHDKFRKEKSARVFYMFLTENKDDEIKGRLVYNGKPTRDFITKQDSTSLTASNESIAITCAIDAKENRDVMTMDVLDAFAQTEILKTKPGEDQVIMKITGKLVDMMIEINPTLYSEFVVKEGNRKVIYVEILRALYGMLISSLLWYKKF